jgi:23S rRNA pseudouridine2604 synthase
MGLPGFFWLAVALAAQKQGLRVNRALWTTHSRREANRFIEQGRLSVNGRIVTCSDDRLAPGDQVEKDGVLVDWEQLVPHVYLKYNKPVGIVCTTDRRIKSNILDALEQAIGSDDDNQMSPSLFPRLFPIGRLDAESTGLILLTSDGGIVNPLLRSSSHSNNSADESNKVKEYHVETSPPATDENIQDLAKGVVITTMARRNGGMEPITARTLSCSVERHNHQAEVGNNTNGNSKVLVFWIVEGRNRQIRKMCAALDLQVTSLHRVAMAGVSLRGCETPGDWARLSVEEEMVIGARQAPTREEQRTPEERAKRKLKKANKKKKRVPSSGGV